MIDIKISEKKFGEKTILENIDITIHENGIYGFVGKNGQGKTTLFNCILGLTDFTGSILSDNEKIILNQVAWCATEPDLYDELIPREFYEFYCELTNIKKSTNAFLFEVAENQLIKSFSTGMKKKTYLNAIFQKEHHIYILDEPFDGLDLESNYQLINFLKEKSKTAIVLISSHILEVLYTNCKSIFVVTNKNIEQIHKSEFAIIESLLFM